MVHRGGTLAVLVLLCLTLCNAVFASEAKGQQPKARPGIGMRLATPEEVEKQLREEEAKINAAPSVGGLPPPVSYYLRKRFPTLSVLTRADATEENLRFATAELGQPSPFVCLGDFDGNGLEDAALVGRDTTTNKLVLMAFHHVPVVRNPGGFTTRGYVAYRVQELAAVPQGTKLDELRVICNKPGHFEIPEGGVALTLRNDSVSLGFYLFYFVGTGYQSLLIGD